MSLIQSRANDLYWETNGEKPSVKRRLFLKALIEIHNMAVEDSSEEVYLKGQGPSSKLKPIEEAILKLRIEVPEE